MTTDTDRLLSLAREIGFVMPGGDLVPASIIFCSVKSLAELTERIRQDERERFLELFDACLPDVVGMVLAGALYGHEDIDRLTPRIVQTLGVLNTVEAIRSSGTSKGTAHV